MLLWAKAVIKPKLLLGLAAFLAVVLTAILAREWWLSRQRHHMEVIELPKKERLLFFILGDTGTGNENEYRVANALERECRKTKPDGILLLGDNFYQGGVQSVTDSQWQEKVFQPYGKECLKDVPIYAILGNHDYKGNVDAQIQMTDVAERWHMPHRFYKIEYGDLLQVIALDTNSYSFCFDPNICILDFLRDGVQQSDHFQWNIALGHHPMDSASQTYQGGRFVGDRIRERVLKHFLCQRVDAYLAGHAHHLEHRREADCSTDLFISGGGGGDLYGVLEGQPETLFAKSQHGFLALEVTQETLTWKMISDSGEVLYQTLTRK